MWKMLPKQLAKLNKLKLEKETSSTVKLTSSLNPSKSKTLNNNILHRENIVSAVLLRELQVWKAGTTSFLHCIAALV